MIGAYVNLPFGMMELRRIISIVIFTVASGLLILSYHSANVDIIDPTRGLKRHINSALPPISSHSIIDSPCNVQCVYNETLNLYLNRNGITGCPNIKYVCDNVMEWMKCTSNPSRISQHWSFESYASFECLASERGKESISKVQDRLFSLVKDKEDGFHLFPDYAMRQRQILFGLSAIFEMNVPGDIVEFGTYQGVTTAAMTMLRDEYGQVERTIHGFDSFEGLPDADDGQHLFVAHQLASPQEVIVNLFKSLDNLPQPLLHAGYFNETPRSEVPEKIAFAFLDGDFHASIEQALVLVYPKLVPGGMIMFDDYLNRNLPGVTRAVDEFVEQHSEFWYQRRWPSPMPNNNLALLHSYVEAILVKGFEFEGDQCPSKCQI